MEIVTKKLAGVILAAGSAHRMGRIKQLLPFRGKPILDHVINNAQRSVLSETVLVLGHCSDLIQRELNFLNNSHSNSSDIKIIINKEYRKGQSDSLKKGLEHISFDCDGAMFLLGDQPLVNETIINKLIYAFETSDLPIVIPYCNGKRGNPVIIARSLFFCLKSLTADTGARVLFKKLEHKILKVAVADQAILEDIDTKEDYDRLLAEIL